MRIGVDTAQQQQTWEQLLARVRFAEEVGFDGVWLFDHFKVMYGDLLGPCLEAWTLLAALGAATERIHLATLVTGMTYRHPSMLAMEAVTVDHVSGGRLELAVGAGWFKEEHEWLGIEFPDTRTRVERLEEGVQVMRLLMTQDDATFEGKHFHLRGATFRPRPVQQPHPPIWIGARGEKLMLPVVARQADVWHGGGSVEDLKRKSALLDRYATEAGRDPASIKRASSLSLSEPWDEIRERGLALKAAGFSYLVAEWPSEGEERVAEFAERIMPELLAE